MRKRKLISILLSVALLFSMNGIASATERNERAFKVKQAAISESIAEISSEEELRKIADDLSGDYVLTKSITLKKGWKPLGDNKSPFTGTFNGNGHVIRCMDMHISKDSESSFAGLFGVMDGAKVENIALEDFSIKSDKADSTYIGGIAGKMINSTVNDVYVSGNIKNKDTDTQTIGGVVGAVFHEGTDLKETYSLKNIFSRVHINKSEKGEMGSIAGWVSYEECLQNCYTNNGELSVTGLVNAEYKGSILTNQLALDKENYEEFDFENIWEMTDVGAKLISQARDDKKASYKEAFAYPTDTVKKEAKKETVKPSVPKEKSVVKRESAPIVIKKAKKDSSKIKKAASNDLVSGDFTYTVSGVNAAITGYTGGAGNVAVPENIGGYTVTKVAQDAFKDTKITGVNLPKSITEIGNYAFRDCLSLETVTMEYNSTVEYTASIGDGAFSGCTALTGVILPENVTSIRDYAFSGCTALEELTLPESLTELGECFIASTAIASITIPKNVSHCGRYDGNGPLANCKTLKAVIFEDGMTKIPAYIMASNSYNSYVTRVSIPDTVTEIGGDAFRSCKNLELDHLPVSIKT
ncbi:MAG: leucine-rich repeat protein, partial [Lachnospiraceae bacterium]|nr:leucine-rich repeat protein [Lachnospiraceae bacterium]